MHVLEPMAMGRIPIGKLCPVKRRSIAKICKGEPGGGGRLLEIIVCAVPQGFSAGVEAHTGHHRSAGEDMAN